MSWQLLTIVIQKWSQKRTWKNNVHISSAVSDENDKSTKEKQKRKTKKEMEWALG